MFFQQMLIIVVQRLLFVMEEAGCIVVGCVKKFQHLLILMDLALLM